MKPQLLFVHSAGAQSNHQGSGPLLSLLRWELAGEFDIHAPAMPVPENPAAESWLGCVQQTLQPLDGPVVLIGHSLGGSVLLQYLAQCRPSADVVALYLLAAPFWGMPAWHDLSFALPRGFADVIATIPEVRFYHSHDDDTVPISHLHEYGSYLPHASLNALNGYGHLFNVESFPQLFADLRVLKAALTQRPGKVREGQALP